jgi:hypothetical protein
MSKTCQVRLDLHDDIVGWTCRAQTSEGLSGELDGNPGERDETVAPVGFKHVLESAVSRARDDYLASPQAPRCLGTSS